MEDDDTDAGMVDYAQDGPFGRCRPKLCPSLLQLILGRHSGIGNRIPRFPAFGGISRFPIPEWPGFGT